jgi:hypothetical protein
MEPISPSPDLTTVLRELHANEIGYSLEAFYDAGIEVKLGDHLNGFKAERVFAPEDFDLIPRWLAEQTCLHFPDSPFAQAHPTPKLSS